MRDASSTRRRVLVAVAGAVAGAAAGCVGGGDGDGSEPGGRDATDAGSTDAGSAADDPTDATAPGGDPDLDLREANVVGVAVERDGDAYDFDVTLHHDDDGEEGYANWWQVERLDGARLGRRELLHAHSGQPFTRSETVEVPADVDCVVVRGHDETHGYGGRLAVVDLASGATRSVEQGSDPRSVDADDCPGG